MNTKKYFFAFAILLFVFTLVPLQSQAQGLVQCGGLGQPACRLCDIFILIHRIIKDILGFWIPIIALPFFVMGGIYLMIGGASPERLKKAKDILIATIVGIVIVYLSAAFLGAFLSAVGVAKWTGLGTGFQFTCEKNQTPSQNTPPINNPGPQSTPPNFTNTFVGVTQPTNNEETPEPNF